MNVRAIPLLAGPLALGFSIGSCKEDEKDERSLKEICVDFHLKSAFCYGYEEYDDYANEYCDYFVNEYASDPDYRECAEAYGDWWRCMAALTCSELMSTENPCPVEAAAADAVCDGDDGEPETGTDTE